MAEDLIDPTGEPRVIHAAWREAAIARARECGARLPTFAELAKPSAIPASVSARLARVDPDAASPDNLWRIHWYNGADRRHAVPAPDFVVLPPSFTGVKATILVMLGARFPLIRAHKVLPAYAALATRLVSGQFNPSLHRAVWPSTGNYCRGGVAVSRILGCRGVAVLPQGMSRERFEWLEKWTLSPDDIKRTPGTESNVKEIYDACKELARSDENVILNQFSAFSNYMIHRLCTGAACDNAFAALAANASPYRLAAFVSATGSAGTLAAGDHLKKRFGSRIAAVEALECPTMLENGFGEHNIQGIGDKHVPLIHNVMNTDFVIAVSDSSTNGLGALLSSEVGRSYLASRRKIDPATIASLADFGFSGLANVIACIKLAKYMRYEESDVIVTVATDDASLYRSENQTYLSSRFDHSFDQIDAAELYSASTLAAATDNMIELDQSDRRRVFNLGYYTWVEQQGTPLAAFEERRRQGFWDKLAEQAPIWDRLIDSFNEELGANPS